MEIVEKMLEKIREARKAKNITQKELGQLLGLSQNSYKNIETGQSELKMPVFLKICQILEIDNLIGEKELKIEVNDAHKDKINFLNYLIKNKENLKELAETLKSITTDFDNMFLSDFKQSEQKQINPLNRVKQINLKATASEKELIILDAQKNEKSIIDNYLEYIKRNRE